MLRRALLVLVSIAALVILALPALSAEQPKTAPAAAAQAPALTADQNAKLAKLRALPAPDPSLTLSAQAGQFVLKALSARKEISCGIYLYPPNANPAATAARIYLVNSTGQALPAGAKKVEWEVEGYPASCCKGVGYVTTVWPPNPPTAVFLATPPMLNPPQPWTRPCKAWVTLP